MMNLHLAEISAGVAPGAQALLGVDGAGWHASAALKVPDNITLLHLLPDSPELNPVENVWADLRRNKLSHRVFATYDAIVEAWLATPGTGSSPNPTASPPSAHAHGLRSVNDTVRMRPSSRPSRPAAGSKRSGSQPPTVSPTASRCAAS